MSDAVNTHLNPPRALGPHTHPYRGPLRHHRQFPVAIIVVTLHNLLHHSFLCFCHLHLSHLLWQALTSVLYAEVSCLFSLSGGFLNLTTLPLHRSARNLSSPVMGNLFTFWYLSSQAIGTVGSLGCRWRYR